MAPAESSITRSAKPRLDETLGTVSAGEHEPSPLDFTAGEPAPETGSLPHGGTNGEIHGGGESTADGNSSSRGNGNTSQHGGMAGVGSELVTELNRRLAESARRCYPSAAGRLRLRGEIGLQFCLTAEGEASFTATRGSTGSSVLDRAARECVLAGALPIHGLAGCYDVVVKFSERP